MKRQQSKASKNTAAGVASSTANGFLPNSIKFISSCIKTVSSGARSAAASISPDSDDCKDQVLWACFDRLETGPSTFKNVLLLGYANGFQVLDVEDATNVTELVSKRDDPCTFMQVQPVPAKSNDTIGLAGSHPLLLIVACDEGKGSDFMLRKDGCAETPMGKYINSGSNVRFYSMRSDNYVHVLRFRSEVYMVRCSARIIAVGLASQIYCFDAATLENKFSVWTYPIPQPGVQGMNGVNIGYGPMDVGSRWLAFTPYKPILTATGRLSPRSSTPSPGVSPSTSPGHGSLVTQYAMESSKQLASGLISLGDTGYKKLSKYCQELLPDNPNFPISSNSSWKVGRPKGPKHSSETDHAGMVVVKDFVSKAIVSQFKAHCSPISALCFDPSGTLLVTASIHGNNINIFRIMASGSHNRSESQSHSWTSSHVHLYKLHRGITSAGIQHICFSHYSQWVTIVSSKGTCHIYVLSPFGGESALQVKNHGDGPTVALMLPLPWWHVPSYTKSQHYCPATPPSPVLLSVVSRIRTGNSGWLNTASAAAGMASITSSAVSAVFHCSIASRLERNGSKANALEHLLVYSPSGHLIQYEMVPATMGERNEPASVTGSLSMVHMADDELRVQSEPVQWWDVCRRADWLEKEQRIPRMTTLSHSDTFGLGIHNSNVEDNDTSSGRKTPVKLQERSHWYLSNAEVQMSYGRVPIWQRSKIHFFTMSFMGPDGLNFSDEFSGGEVEIETFLGDEVEFRCKDLLPAYHSQNVQSSWSDREFCVGRYPYAMDKSLIEEKYAEEAMNFTNKPNSPKTVQKSELGSALTPRSYLNSNQLDMCMYYPPSVHTLVEKNVKRSSSTSVSTFSTQGPVKSYNMAAMTDISAMNISPPQNICLVNTSSSLAPTSTIECTILKNVQSSNSVATSEGSHISSNRSDFSMNLVDEGSRHELYQEEIDFGQFFQEEYCKASPDESHDMGEVVTDVDSSSSPHIKERPEEDMESDEMLGGMFAFAEEG